MSDSNTAPNSNPVSKRASDDLPQTHRSLPIAMLRARENIMAPYRKMLGKIDITEQQWRVLRVLDERGTMDPKDIAEAACLLNPSLTRIMQLLERKELITRRSHPDDKRKVLVDISDGGRAMLTEAMPQSAVIGAKLEAKFGPQKRRELLNLLNELSELDLE